ncbi:hypothetical protein K461DRAFT_295442 [Myriangium duriaei CBS 260.36]|uniref:Uncharacterized protein n=1 Tax=Myriangium duriaei CBS 260.36 TaxID=1168546 RepID=A0A9P4IWU5_9PEZI|nr:hypothetical protein K461DRAFT_295442 [Myriangium duriaei CBS 260.36]
MGRLSILPESLCFVETAISWLFIALAVITIGPWALVFVYDFFLYIWRSLVFDIPYIGGASRGKQRPRAPSLVNRPDGHRRRFSLAALSVDMKPVDLKQFVIPEEDDSRDEFQDERNDSVIGDGSPTEHRHRKARPLRPTHDDVAVHD